MCIRDRFKSAGRNRQPPAPIPARAATVTDCKRRSMDKQRLCVHPRQRQAYEPGQHHWLAEGIFPSSWLAAYQPARFPAHRGLCPSGKRNGHCHGIQAVGARQRKHDRELLQPYHRGEQSQSHRVYRGCSSAQKGMVHYCMGSVLIAPGQ